MLFVAKGKKLDLISTDGRRLAQAKGDLISDKLGKDGAKAIVPAKALGLIDKLVDDPEEPVEFQVRENQVVFHTPHATLTSNLVEGQFPPYEDVIPKDTDKKMTAGDGRLPGRDPPGGPADDRGEQGRAVPVLQEGPGAPEPQPRGGRGDDQLPLQVRRGRHGDRLQPHVPDRRA